MVDFNIFSLGVKMNLNFETLLLQHEICKLKIHWKKYIWLQKFLLNLGSYDTFNFVDFPEWKRIHRIARIHIRTAKKDLHDPDNDNGVITNLKPDILECEVKWALESITMNKASRGDRTPVELFQILKDDAVKVLHSVHHQICKTQ